ncbi:hypothetical protein HPB48_002863 [Haemaphysalis longicornis]|uniref:Uncharacterized protein n=1 Tax=Haemaphysalis longicornis TaxID=44386 RepID=A0A9J6FXM9_HAELO|nr:hypothetical protein HPB48_002863 [Haemaphysalis longicornis]
MQMKRSASFGFAIVLSSCAGAASPLVPNLCRLMDQPMYCRCDGDDYADDATDVSCYITRPLTADHVVFKSFQNHLSLVSLTFNAFDLKYKLSFVPSEALKQCAQLERLKFTQSDLGVLKTHSNAITELEPDSIANIPRLKRLELGDNKLTKVPAGALRELPALAQVFLERNDIRSIEDGAFADLRNVKELDLSDNAIETLSARTFEGLSRVVRLDLFRNKVRRLEARTFSALPALVELDLKYNGVAEVDPLAFEGLPQLSVLYLSYNRLRILPAHMFRGAPNLVTVDLSQNQLLTLTWRSVQDLSKIRSEAFDMSLTGNEFMCDCRLAWMLYLENATRNEKFRRELRHVKCSFEQTPPGNMSSSGTKVARLSLRQLGCPDDYAPPDLPSTTRAKKVSTACPYERRLRF